MAQTITPPNTKTTTSHALTIHAVSTGAMVGAINQWNPQQSLQISPVHEFGQVTGPHGVEAGMPFEKIPGNVSGMTIEVNRYDIYTQRFEEAFGTIDLTVLSNDPNAFDVRESWRAPDPANSYTIVYFGCRFSRLGRTLSATDDRIVKVGATLEYTRPMRLRGQA